MAPATPPGWYHASGDPAGTVRYWDGTTWTATPVAPPEGWVDLYANDPSTSGVLFAPLGVRIWASVIDVGITTVLLIPFIGSFFSDVLADVEAGGDGSSVAIPVDLLWAALGINIAMLLMVAFMAGTPGKLIMKLRITREDGTTTPPGLWRAFLRTLPTAVQAIPGVGSVLLIAVIVASAVMISNDTAQRQSLFDRVGQTRVVRAD